MEAQVTFQKANLVNDEGGPNRMRSANGNRSEYAKTRGYNDGSVQTGGNAGRSVEAGR